MKQYEEVLRLMMEALKDSGNIEVGETDGRIPVGVSNRHIHLSQQDLDTLFGVGYELTKIKDLSQPGQYACKETVTICGPKGAIETVRILGPARQKTQVEILAGDCFKLGVRTMPKLSGDLAGTPGITIVGPKGSVLIKEGLMIAQRHIHMHPADTMKFGVSDGQIVKIEIPGERGGILNHVLVRATKESKLECHIDTEEANAIGLNCASYVKIIL